MATENNSLTNSFYKGMDTDTSYQMIDEGKYVFAKNVRISSLHQTGDGDTTNKYGEIRPIEGVVSIFNQDSDFKVEWKIDNEDVYLKMDSILATTSIRKYGLIIVKGRYYQIPDEGDDPVYTDCISVLRFIDNDYLDDQEPIDDPQDSDDGFKINVVFTSKNYADKIKEFPLKLSIETRWEDDDNVKLYIATGIDPVYVLNVAPSNDTYNESLQGNVDKIKSYPEVQFTPPIFRGIIQGMLKPAQVQYSYLLYNKNGIYSDVSPLTKQISIPETVGGGNIYRETTKGVQKGKKSNCGVALKFNIPVDYLGYIRVFRVTYEESGLIPTIEIISDIKYNATELDGQRFIYFNDVGQNALLTLTVEEYNNIAGIHIIPKVIESKNDRLFAANIKSESFTTDTDIIEWDARAYRFKHETINGEDKLVSELYTYSNAQSGTPDIKIIYNGDNTNFDVVPTTHDCYNLYNDINQQIPYSESYDNNGVTDYRIVDVDKYCILDGEGCVGGIGKNVSWKFVIGLLYPDIGMKIVDPTPSIPDDNMNYVSDKDSRIIPDSAQAFDGNIPSPGYIKYDSQTGYSILLITDDCAVNWCEPIEDTKGLSYTNPNITFSLKSLKRDELYRYGIILYDKFGNNSGVKWIADIRTPQYNDIGCFPFHTAQDTRDENTHSDAALVSIPLGILFTVNNLPSTVSSYEIVRCNRTISDVKNISQGVLSRPIKARNTNVDYPYTPTGLLTISDYWTGHKYMYWQIDDNSGNYKRNIDTGFLANSGKEADNFENTTVFLFISPEVCYQEEYVKSIITSNDFKLKPLVYVFPNIDDGSSRSSGSIVFDLGGNDPRIAFYLGEDAWEYLKPALAHSVAFKKITPARFGLSLFHKCEHPGNTDSWPYTMVNPTAIYNAAGMSEASFLNPGNCIPVPYITDYYLYGDTELRMNDCKYPINQTTGPVSGGIFTFKEAKKTQYSYTKMYPDLRFNMLNPIDDDDARESLSYIKPMVYDISDIKIPTTFQWDGGYGVERSDTESNKKYKSGVIAVGTSQYCNWVIGGMYDEPVWSTSDEGISVLGRDIWVDDPGKITTGPGGKCMILELKQSNSYISKPRLAQIYTEGLSQPPYVNYTSMVGTWLCNLQQKIIPYGGYDYTSRTLNTYYSYGDFVKVDDPSSAIVTNVFNGDTFLSPFEYVSMHKMYNGIPASTGLSQTIVYALPCETSINLAYTYGEEISKEYTDPKVVNVQPEPANVYNVYVQQEPLYSYNGAYSASPNVNTLASELNRDDVEDFTFDYRCYFSELKSNDERLESWTKFMPANFLDADSAKGEITNMQTFHDKLMFWQTQGTGLFSVNERSTITDDSNLPLILGTGGVLERYDYIDDTAGMAPEQYCDTMSDSTLYWWDDYNQEIKSYKTGSTVLLLSKVGNVQSTLHKYSDTNKIPSMFFDDKYNEVVSNVMSTDVKTPLLMVFNERVNGFTSVYDINYYDAIKMPSRTYLVDVHESDEDNLLGVSQWNKVSENTPKNTDGSKLSVRLDYVVNKSPLVTKVFDNQEIVTVNKPYSPQYLEGEDSGRPASDVPYFKTHDNVSLTYNWITDLNMASSDDLDMTYREGNYRYAIPRSSNAEYGNRMRGKYMVCTIEDEAPHYDASISFIITKFRASWS